MNMFQLLEIDFSALFSLENLLLIVVAAVIILVTFIADRLVLRSISKYSKRVKLEEHAENILRLIARLVIVAVGVVALLQHLGVGVEWFVGLSALTGAAIGFASTQTVGNFLAGLYIMISRPFMVRDYVKIGDVEGEVREITINYTKIYTPTYNIMEIPNRKVLDSTILNYSTKKDIIDYSIQMGFPHSENMTNKELIEKCIVPGLEEFYNKYKDILLKKPELGMNKMTRLERGFLIRLFFPEGKIDTLYDIQPELLQNIVNSWDAYKMQKRRR
ncbi:MAG: mechanosensitive ion channel family protein [Candidatus Bathyarchaeia archaeon]